MTTLVLRGKRAHLFASTAPAVIPAPSPGRDLVLANLARRKAEDAANVFTPSPQQQAFFDWIETGSGNALLIAVAGAGKTTTLIQGMDRMSGNIFCGAYNRSAALDIKAKAEKTKIIRPGIFISTMHGAGYSEWVRAYPDCRNNVSDLKVLKLIDDLMKDYPAKAEQVRMASQFIRKLVSFGKQFLIGCPGKPEISNGPVWDKIVDHFSVDQALPETVDLGAALEWMQHVYQRSADTCPTGIDFDDMLFAPNYYGTKSFRNAWFLGDEWQDANPARRAMAHKMLAMGGRAIFVGDPKQAIYGFTGAGGDSLAKTKEEFNCTELPLTVTYRCPKAVVSYVHQWVSHIEAHPDAPEGAVRAVVYEAEKPCPGCNGTGQSGGAGAGMWDSKCDACNGDKTIPAKPWFMQDAPAATDAILCRYTKPLIQTAYGMIRNGIACKVEGRDIGKGLVAVCRMWKIRSIKALEDKLVGYLAREIEKARKAQSERREQEITDKVETIRIFIERCRLAGKTSIDELVLEIESLFADDVKGMVVLCTGHKAKGREWPRVYWLQTGQRMRLQKEWEAEQETNIKYVIGTRAMQELVLVPEALIGG